MPAYVWSCLACGGGNEPNAAVCSVCGCTASADIAQIELFREQHVRHGGQIRPTAALIRQPEDPTAYEVLVAPVLFVATGVAPGEMLPRKFSQALWQFLLAAAAAFLLAYSVTHWSWPPVGFEWAMFVTWFCLVLGSLFTLGAGVVWLRMRLRQSSNASEALESHRSTNEG